MGVSGTMHSAIDIGGSPVQQDCIRMNPTTIVVCDGHGQEGHLFAQAVCDYLIGAEGTPAEIFRQMDATLRRTLGYVQSGGTTCTYVSIDPDTHMITVANIGDSDARYWDELGPGCSASSSHSPSTFSEYQRIVDMGGVCFFHDATGKYRKGRAPVFIDGILNREGGYYYKNCRKEYAIYMESCPPKDYPYELHTVFRLAVTRSFGDWPLVQYGLLAEPSIQVVPPPREGCIRAFVVATDGLWDVLTDDQIGAIVRNPHFLEKRDSSEASLELMKAAQIAGRALHGVRTDNIALVVMYL